MKFSVMELFQHPAHKTVREVIDDAIEQAVVAEELGFDGIWLAEHHFSTYGVAGSPLLLAAAIAQRTERIRIGTAVLVLPFYEPIRLAEEIALLDHLSNGRIQIGIGRGYQPEEFRGFRVDPSASREIASEVAQILQLSWTEDRFSFQGEHFQMEDLSVLPKPLQEPHPPLYQAAVSMGSFQAAGETGAQILTSPNFTPLDTVKKQFDVYERALVAAGFNPAQFERPMMQKVYIGEDATDAYDTPKSHAQWYQALLATLVPGADGHAPKGYEQWERISGNMNRVSYDDIRKGSNFNDADEAIEVIRRLEAAGVDSYISWFTFGTMEAGSARKSMERFARDVMPAFA